jgi:hypothetical protein
MTVSPVMVLVRTGGPQPYDDVQWTRGTVKVLADGIVLRRSEAKKPNRNGRVAVCSTGWQRVRPADVERYIDRLKLAGFREVEQWNS